MISSKHEKSEMSNRSRSIIFISCATGDDLKVEKFVKELKAKASNITIYFSFHGENEDDKSQQLRYHAVESSQCMVAFLSSEYFSSRVCLEEYNIALAKQLSHNAFYLLPIHTDAVDLIPRSLSSLPCVDVTGGESQITILAEIIDQILNEFRDAHNLKPPDVAILREKLEEKRASEFPEKFRLDGGNITWNTTSSSLDYGLTGQVVFLCAQDCLTFAAILSAILKQHTPGLASKIQLLHTDSQPYHDRLLTPTNTDIIVAFISDQFAGSAILNAELHSLLCRQRDSKQGPAVYAIQSQHHLSHPLFLHVLPLPVCLDDKIWRRLERACSNRNPRYTVNLANAQGLYRCTAAQNLALSAAAFDIIHSLSYRDSWSVNPTNVVSLAKQDDELKGLKEDKISVHEYIISLDSLHHTVSRKAATLRECLPSVPAIVPPPSSSTAGKEGNHSTIHSSELSIDVDVNIKESSNVSCDSSRHSTPDHGRVVEDESGSPRDCYDVNRTNEEDVQHETDTVDRCDGQSEADFFSSHTSITSVASTSSLLADKSTSRTVDGCEVSNGRFSILCQII